MSVFEFKTFTLDPNTIRLKKQGQTVDIEPQSFEALLLLVKNNNRVVTKEELLQEVWQGRLVTDNVITRTIYEIRKIIDAGDSKGSMIRTVRGKGYQFTAEVNLVVKQTSAIAEGVESTTGGLSKKMMLLFVILVALISWFLYQNQQSPQVTTSTASMDSYPVVAILPISVDVGSEELSILTQSVVDYLATQLALNLRMKVIHPDNMSMLENQFSDIWSIQEATRATFIIQGFIESVSDQIIKIHLTLYKKNIENELTPYSLGGFEFPYPHTIKDLNDLYKQRKITVRDIVNLIKPGLVINDQGDTMTNDPEAYRMAITAHHIMRSDSCEKIHQSDKLLKQAVDKAPKFAYAWHKLFANYLKRVWLCGESTENYQKALEVAEIVEKLAPNQYKSVAIGRNGVLIETNQVELAYEYVQDSDWNDPDSLYREVYALRYAGFLNLAREKITRILQLDPFYFNEKPIHQSPNTLLYMNQFKAHLELLAEPGNAYHDYYRGLNLFLNHDVDGAKIILQNAVNRTPNDLFGQFSAALLFIINGQNDESIKIIDSIVNKRNEKNHSDGEMTYKLVQLYALSGEINTALSQLQLAVDQGFFPFNYFQSDPALALIQNTNSFNQMIEQARSRHVEFAQKFNLSSEFNSEINK